MKPIETLSALAEHLHGKRVTVFVDGLSGFSHGNFRNLNALFFLLEAPECDCFIFWKDVLKINAEKDKVDE